MSIPSGGAPLGPQDPTSIDTADTRQTGAASQVQRQNVGMVQDTMTQSFTQLPSGKVHTDGAQPDRPSLQGPITTLLVAPNSQDNSTQAAVQEQYHQLIEQLPVEQQVAIIRNNQLPVEKQDPTLTAANAALMTLATSTVWSKEFNSSEHGAPTPTTPGHSEGATTGSGATVVTDADGKPIQGQPGVGQKGGDGQGSNGQGQNPDGSPAGIQTSNQFWAANSTTPGADAQAFLQANLPPGATTADQAQLAAINGIPGPLSASLDPSQQKTLLVANSLQMLTGQQTTVAAALTAAPANSPLTPVLSDFLKLIATAIQTCEKALFYMMQQQTNIENAYSEAKTDTMMDKLKLQLEELQKAAESGKSSSGKMIGMIIMAVVSAILTVITGGILAILVCETIIGAVAMVAVAIALAVTELVLAVISTASTVNVIAEIMKLLADILHDMGIPSPAAEIIVAVAVIVVLVILIVAAVALCMICPEDIAELADVLLEAVVNISTLVISNSNCISTILVPILEAMGVPPDVAQVIAEIVTMIVCLMLVFVSIGAAGQMVSKGTKMIEQATQKTEQDGTEAAVRGGSVLNKIGEQIGAQTAEKMMKWLNVLSGLAQAAVQGTQAAIALGQAISYFKKAELALELGNIEELIADANAYLQMLDATMKDVGNSIEETMSEIANMGTLMSHIISTESQTVGHLEQVG